MPPSGRLSAEAAAALLLLLALFLASCSSTSIYVPVTHPAVFPLDEARVLYLLTFTADAEDSPFLRAAQSLLPTRLDSALQARFPDKSIIRAGEQRLSGEDRALYLSSRIRKAIYTEGVSSAELFDPDRSPDVKRERKAVAHLEVDFILRDAEHKVRGETTLTANGTAARRSVNEQPPALNADSLHIVTIDRMVAEFLERVQPQREMAVVSFLTDSDHPEIARGIILAKKGEWEQAIGIFRELALRLDGTEGSDRLWYNLGIACQYHHDFRTAMEAFEHAREIRPSKRYDHAIEELLDMEERWLHLRGLREQ